LTAISEKSEELEKEMTPEKIAEKQVAVYESSYVKSSSIHRLLPILLQSFQRKRVAEIKIYLKMI
jgi:hypothetical protein